MNNEKIDISGFKVFVTNSSVELPSIVIQGADVICNLDKVEVVVKTETEGDEGIEGIEGVEGTEGTEPKTQFQYTSVLIPNGKFYDAGAALQLGINIKCQKYLNDTDWYVTRKLESGVEIPTEISLKREECRQQIVK